MMDALLRFWSIINTNEWAMQISHSIPGKILKVVRGRMEQFLNIITRWRRRS